MSRTRPVALVVDREGEATRGLVAFLRAQGFDALWARDSEGAHQVLDRTRASALVTEWRSRRIDGASVLRRARERVPDVCAVVVAGRAEAGRAAEAMALGAEDFQLRPLQRERLLVVLRRGLERQALGRRARDLEAQLDRRFGFEGLTAGSRAMQRVLEQVRHVATTRAPVLIEGEPGAGKSLVARALHRNSSRRDGRFVWVHCAAVPVDAMEGELFGYQPAAGEARRGRFEQADGGTLFLDDVAGLPPPVQVKLVRALQERTFERVGGSEPVRADVRLVASTDRDLAGEVRAGRFREDLAERLAVVRIRLPALRERREDIPLLAERFVRELAREHGRRVTGVTRGVLDRLLRYAWPGNVRELKSTLEGMVVFAHGRRALDLTDLPPALREAEGVGERFEVTVGMTLDEAERQLIAATLRHTGHDKRRAAAILGMGLRTLYRKLKTYGGR